MPLPQYTHTIPHTNTLFIVGSWHGKIDGRRTFKWFPNLLIWILEFSTRFFLSLLCPNRTYEQTYGNLNVTIREQPSTQMEKSREKNENLVRRVIIYLRYLNATVQAPTSKLQPNGTKGAFFRLLNNLNGFRCRPVVNEFQIPSPIPEPVL